MLPDLQHALARTWRGFSLSYCESGTYELRQGAPWRSTPADSTKSSLPCSLSRWPITHSIFSLASGSPKKLCATGRVYL